MMLPRCQSANLVLHYQKRTTASGWRKAAGNIRLQSLSYAATHGSTVNKTVCNAKFIQCAKKRKNRDWEFRKPHKRLEQQYE